MSDILLSAVRFAILRDKDGHFLSLALVSPVDPVLVFSAELVSFGFMWVDIGVDGTPESPVWKMWDGQVWRLVGGADGLTTEEHTAIGDSSPHHTAVTLGAGSAAELTLAGQELTLAAVLTAAEHIAIGDYLPHHAAVTLGAESAGELKLDGQELTLAAVLTPTAHTAIGDSSPHHAAVTLAADADVLLDVTGQEIGLDTQAANTVLAGPAAGGAADPTFRALVDADIPNDSIGGAQLNPGSVFGASAKKLLNFVPYGSAYLLYRPLAAVGDTNFTCKINQPTWGTPSGATVAYDTVVGDENYLAPYDGANQLGKLVLHNTTRGTEALVSNCDTSTNVITLTGNVPSDWRDNDDLTLRSSVCDTGSSPYYFDLDCSGFLPSTAVAIFWFLEVKDTAAAGAYARMHPCEPYAAGKILGQTVEVANLANAITGTTPVISQRVCFTVDASGVGTVDLFRLRVFGWFEEAAT